MRTNPALLTKEDGGSPTRNPSMDTEDARVASLITLEDIYKQSEVHFLIFLTPATNITNILSVANTPTFPLLRRFVLKT